MNRKSHYQITCEILSLLLLLMLFSSILHAQDSASVSNVSLEQQQSKTHRWKYHPPEFYHSLRKEFRDHLVKMKAEFVADELPEYRTEIAATDKTINLKRQLYSISFSKASCGIDNAVIRGEKLNEAGLLNLTVVAEDGTTYSQLNAIDGKLTVRDEQFNVYLEGEFTPRSDDGRELGAIFGITYNFYKMAGLLTVKYRVKEIEGETAYFGIQKISSVPPIKRITVYSTLGLTQKPLNYYFRQHGLGVSGKYYQAKCFELTSDEDRIIMPDKRPYCLWTNGSIGFGVYAMGNTYSQIDIESNSLNPKYFAYELKNKKRLISVTFRHSMGTSSLDKDFKADLALVIYPIKRFKPTSRILGWSFLNTQIAQVFKKPRDVGPAISKLAQRGGNAFVIGGCNEYDIFPSNEVPGPYKITAYEDTIRTWNDLYHQNGIETMWGQLGGLVWSNDLLEAEGFFTPEEMVSVRKDRSKSNPLVREFMLTKIYYYLTKLGFDGIYFDLIADKLERSTVFLQDVRLLCDSLPGDKFFTYHNHMEVSAPMALADYSVPGEQFVGAKWDSLPMSYLEIPYNPMISGIHNWAYTDRSYDLRSLTIWKEFVRNVCAPPLAPYMPEEFRAWRRPGSNIKEARENFRKYGLAYAIFDVGSAQFHQRYDEDYSEYARVSNPEVTVNVFSRTGETMITVSNGIRERDDVVIALNKKKLGLGGGEVIVYDTVGKDIIPASTQNAWLELAKFEITDAPFIIVVKAVKPNEPTMLWHDGRIRDWHVTKPLRIKVGFRMIDFAWKSLPGPAITAFYCGELGRPKNLWWTTSFCLDRYDRKNKIAYILTDPAPGNSIVKGSGSFCFDWDEK